MALGVLASKLAIGVDLCSRHVQRLRLFGLARPRLFSSSPSLPTAFSSLFALRFSFLSSFLPTTTYTTLFFHLFHDPFNSPNMVHVKASLIALSALASTAYAAAASVNTPTSLIQCQPYQLSE